MVLSNLRAMGAWSFVQSGRKLPTSIQEGLILIIQTIRERLLAGTMIGGVALAGAVALPVTGVLFAPTSSHAQDYTSGVLTGTVTDEAGAPVSGATVNAVSGQGSVRSATTDANGAFRMPALPVGSYQISISHSSYGSISQRASVTSGSSSYVFVLGSASSSGASDLSDVVVTAARRVQDFNATDTGLRVDVQDLASKVPVGRSINAVTLLSPGASLPDATIGASSRRNQGLASFAGTSAAESSYYVNGLNLTDQRTFLGYGEVPFDFIQSIDVKTGGYQAEYGRATGGIVNIVTRSGTNEFTGGLSVYYTPDKLRASRGTSYQQGGNNVAGLEVYNQYSYSESVDYSAFLGGPIIKDHLFFFGAYNIRDVKSEGARSRSFAYNSATGAITPGASYSQAISSYDDPRWALKLDFVINPNHRIEATWLNDETTTESQTRTYSATTSAGLTAVTDPLSSDAGGLTQIYKYTGVFTDWFTLSALYGRNEASYLDYGNPINLPGVYDYARPGGAGYVGVGRQAGPYNLSGEDIRETYRVDADFYFNLLGEHHLRIGYDREDLTTTATSAYSGGALYNVLTPAQCAGIAPVGQGCLNIVTFANDGEFTGEQSALYIQDSWDITDNFSLQLGVRNDQYTYNNVDGEAYIDLKDQWAPRIGFNWDPFGNKVDRVYGSMGDYYLPIATNTSIRASSGEVYTDAYYAGPTRDGSGNVVLDANGYPTYGSLYQLDYLSPPGAPDPRSVVEADLKPMYEREFILGYEHSFTDGRFADWSVGVRGIYRNLESAIEDTAIGDAIVRYCVRTNTACGQSGPGDAAFSSLFPYVLINPGDGATVYIDLQGDTRTDAAGNPNPDYNPQTVELTADDLGFDKVERTYKALEFTFRREFDGKWGLAGSYTLAKSEGNYEGAVKSDIGQTDTSLTQDYDHVANQLGSFGYLPNHHAHTIKLYGNWALTDRFNVGANFTAQSGRKYGCIGRVPVSVDPLSPQTGTPSGWYCPFGPGNTTIQTPRGSQGETDWTFQTDLNLAYTIVESPRGNVTASVDVFNVFDNDATTRVVEQGLIRTSSNVLTARSPYYGLPRGYQAPRSLRFGLKYTF